MALDFAGLMNRMVAIEKEALAALATPVTADAVPRFWHTQEAFPYFTNRLGTITTDTGADEWGEELDGYTVEVTGRLVLAHITSAYRGENDDKLQSYIPQLIEYFNDHELLQSAAYPVALTSLIRARLVSCRGYTEFQNSAEGSTTQVGTEFTVRCEFVDENEQDYLG